jgi:hypothetical protein
MSKQRAILALALGLILLGLYADPLAAQVTSVSKRGSLIVFPMVVTSSGEDTIVTIGNDSASPTWVKCYWMDNEQNAWDFEFRLTSYQPVWFSAKTGQGSITVSEFGDFKLGELKCWAIDINPPAPSATEELKQFNYLYGSAIYVAQSASESFEYPAWAFALNNKPLDPSGPINLNGTEYDYCPSYLVYNFFADASSLDILGSILGNGIILSPCQQDLRQDRSPVCTKAKFDVWNENESKLTGAYQCVKCYFAGDLEDIGLNEWNKCDLGSKCKKTGYRGINFSHAALKTDLGRFRVSPELSSACNNVFSKFGQDGKTPVDVCAGNQIRTPFVGINITGISFNSAFFYPATTGTQAGQFTNPTKTGGVPPQILWDTAGATTDAARR